MPAPPQITHRLDLIVCPACRSPLAASEKDPSISCTACRRRYSIEDGIPVLIPDRAKW